MNFQVINDYKFLAEYDDPYAIIVLVEEELVAIDLKSENWPTFRQPYLCSPHSSAMTCAHHAASVPEVFWKKLQEAGASQSAHYSSSDWPITGGKINNQQPSNRDVLITGYAWWLGTRLQYLHYSRTGDTAVLHWTIGLISCLWYWIEWFYVDWSKVIII